MKLFVGLDVSSFDIKVCFLNGEGDELKAFTMTNDLLGATQLRDEILNVVQDQYIAKLRIGLESTSVYSFHPSMFLHHGESLRVLGGQVFVMNPKQIANFKKSYSDMDKTDEIDALDLTTRKFVRLMDALLRKNQIYTARRSINI